MKDVNVGPIWGRIIGAKINKLVDKPKAVEQTPEVNAQDNGVIDAEFRPVDDPPAEQCVPNAAPLVDNPPAQEEPHVPALIRNSTDYTEQVIQEIVVLPQHSADGVVRRCYCVVNDGRTPQKVEVDLEGWVTLADGTLRVVFTISPEAIALGVPWNPNRPFAPPGYY